MYGRLKLPAADAAPGRGMQACQIMSSDEQRSDLLHLSQLLDSYERWVWGLESVESVGAT